MPHTKRDSLIDARSCFSKAAPDEPIFVLRGKDPLAPLVVKLWAQMATSVGTYGHEENKRASAYDVAAEMERYRNANYPAALEVDDAPVSATQHHGALPPGMR
jgi:hypothetical protein